MIDCTTEEIISLTDAANMLPPRRAGKKVHVSCLYRYTVQGCRGVRLEYIQIGGTRCTSKQALQRFFATLTAQEEAGRRALPTPEPPLTAARRKQIETAVQKLEAAGI